MSKTKTGTTFAAILDSDVGLRVETIAAEENRSTDNVIETAVKVFVLLPEESRNILANAADDPSSLDELSRSIMRRDAVRRMDAAMTKMVAEIKDDRGPNPDDYDYDDAIVVEKCS